MVTVTPASPKPLIASLHPRSASQQLVTSKRQLSLNRHTWHAADLMSDGAPIVAHLLRVFYIILAALPVLLHAERPSLTFVLAKVAFA